jgi:hypothetical protein
MCLKSIGCFCLVLALITVTQAQESPRLAEQPVFVARFHGWSQSAVRAYVRRLHDDLQIGTNTLAAMERPEVRESTSTLEAPASGLLVYLAKGLIPSAEQVSYAEVADQSEFVKLVQAQKRQHNDGGVLEGSGDRYKLAVNRVVRIETPKTPASNDPIDETNEVAGPVRQVSAKSSGGTDSQNSGKQQVTVTFGLGANGVIAESTVSPSAESGGTEPDAIETTASYTHWYRYHDGFMFISQSDALWEMSLPSAESLRKESDSDLNGQIAFYPDRIPMGFRHLAWNAINTVTGTELQQRDGEPNDEYAMRRTSGDAGLALLQACIFDTQGISGSMRLAADDEPVRGELKIEARKNSNLGKNLGELASAHSRFAPVLNDDAAATLHVAVKLTEDWRKSMEALRSHLLTGHCTDADAVLETAAREITNSVFSSADHLTLETLLKVGWTRESGAVIYGGIHVDEHPQLLDAILICLRDGASSDESYELMQRDDLQLLQIRVPADANPDFLRLTHLYIAHSNSCLWFALGGENSHAILARSLARVNESGGRQKTPLLTANIDLQRWMDYPQDDETGLTQLPQLYCQVIDSWVGEFGREPNPHDPPGPSNVAFQAMQLGGSKDLSLVMNADQSGMLIQCQLGSALARSWLASFIVAVDEQQAVVNQQN